MSSKKSLQRRFQQLGFFICIVAKNLQERSLVVPNRIQIKRKLTPADKEKCLVMFRLFENKIKEDPDFLDDVWFNDEAHSWFWGHLNWYNHVNWGTEVSDEVLQRNLHSRPGIIGLFWFENADEETVTVTKRGYIDVLDKFWRALGTRRGMNRDVQWFQQDRASPHIARWRGSTINSIIGWSASTANPSGLRNHSIWTLLILFSEDSWRTTCMRSTNNALRNLKRSKIRALPKKKCIGVFDNFARWTQGCHQRNGKKLSFEQEYSFNCY